MDKPILFSGPMVRALLAGTKTQTRRTLKGAPAEATSAGTTYSSETGHSNVWTWLSGDPMDIDTWGVLDDFRLPYKVGDRLYVREHWRCDATLDAIAPRNLKSGLRPIWFEAGFFGVTRNGTPLGPLHPADLDGQHIKGKFRQGMHMPRWASRITLTVTDVRVERLQDISDDDAAAEGLTYLNDGPAAGHWTVDGTPVCSTGSAEAYAQLWEHINGVGSWSANPWVAAYTFTVQMGNIDQLAQAA